MAQQNDTQQRDPDTIQREIEKTRAELADTIDAIADRISPRRAASRGAGAVKSSVSGLFGGGSANGSAPASVLDAGPADAGKVDTAARRRAVESVAKRAELHSIVEQVRVLRDHVEACLKYIPTARRAVASVSGGQLHQPESQ